MATLPYLMFRNGVPVIIVVKKLTAGTQRVKLPTKCIYRIFHIWKLLKCHCLMEWPSYSSDTWMANHKEWNEVEIMLHHFVWWTLYCNWQHTLSALYQVCEFFVISVIVYMVLLSFLLHCWFGSGRMSVKRSH